MQQNKQPTPSIRRHRPFYKLPVFWVILTALVVAGAIFVPRVLAKKPSAADTQPSSQTTSSTTKSDTAQSSETKTTPSDTTTPTDSDGKTPTKYDGEDPNTSASLTGSLTAARFSGDNLILRVNIDQYLSSGTCNLTISDSTHTLAKSANLIPSAATSTCEGFDIAGSELSNFARPLSITIRLASGDKTGIIEGKVE